MKKILFSLALLLTGKTGFTQQLKAEWLFTSPSLSSVNSVSCAPDGSIWTYGRFQDSITIGYQRIVEPGLNLFVAHSSGSGTVSSINIIAKGNNSLVPMSFCIDGDGRSYVALHFDDSIRVGTAFVQSRGGTDQMIISLNPDGSLRWYKQIGGELNDRFYTTAIASHPSQSGIVLCGIVSGHPQIGAQQYTANGEDMLVAKIDGDGNVLWSKLCGGNGSDAGLGVSTDAGGNVYFTGAVFATADIGGISVAGQSKSPFLAKFRSDGTAVWAKVALGTNSQGFLTQVDHSGNVYLAGSSTINSLSFGGLTIPRADYYLAKFDSNGAGQWVRYGHSVFAGETIQALAVDRFSSVYIGGDYRDSITVNGATVLRNRPQGYVLKFDSLGTVTDTISIPVGVTVKTLAVDESLNLYAAGGFVNRIQFLGNTTNSSPWPVTENLFACRYGYTLGAAQHPPDARQQLEVFPNPSNGLYQVKLPAGITKGFLSVLDSRGSLLRRIAVQHPGSMVRLDLSDLASGVYLIELNGTCRQKVVKID